ncbi:hypothetical protein [Embleya sp. AB8]|uniref:hypothetical protein n=1 Tax=Embleya sp. AB8 TaxID=3156304 RepID=UPI003C77D466
MSAKSSSPPVSSGPGKPGTPPSAAAQASLAASPSRDRALTRRLVVGRLLALDQAGTLETVHVRIAAEAAGVSPRTVWRWLAIARESGRAEPASRRHSFAVTDALWARLSDLGGNVKAPHDWMREHPDQAPPSPTAHALPSLTTLYRAVQQEQHAGRVLEISRPAHARRDRDRYDRALAELALPGTACETGRITLPPPAEQAPTVAGTHPAAIRPSPFADGTRLYTPGAPRCRRADSARSPKHSSTPSPPTGSRVCTATPDTAGRSRSTRRCACSRAASRYTLRRSR